MKVYVESEDRKLEVDFDGKAKELLDKLGINRESCLIVKNNEIVGEEEELSNHDYVKILSVISGG